MPSTRTRLSRGSIRPSSDPRSTWHLGPRPVVERSPSDWHVLGLSSSTNPARGSRIGVHQARPRVSERQAGAIAADLTGVIQRVHGSRIEDGPDRTFTRPAQVAARETVYKHRDQVCADSRTSELRKPLARNCPA